jgi:uncharacterized protein with ParB-like and HNH nuclease domain
MPSSKSNVSQLFWSLETLIDQVRDGTLQVPTFHRSLVWSDEKRTNLVSSLLNRHPVGSILVARQTDTEPWQLVDGLQRSFAIHEFMDKPLAYVNFELGMMMNHN